MENLENDVKKPEILSDEQLKEVTGGGDPFAEALRDMRKKECDSAKSKNDCESLSYCLWKLCTPAVGFESAMCVYRG